MAGKGRSAVDLMGRVFGRLAIIRRVGSNKAQKALWLCECSCGTRCTKVGSYLLTGATQSCGCLRHEPYAKKHGHAAVQCNGRKASKTYRAWLNMKERCTNPKNPRWADYGGRGIAVDLRWQSFSNFLDDMGEAPADKTLDRINNNKGYSKDNCRWSDYLSQRRNRRDAVITVVINDEELTLVDAVKKYSRISYDGVLMRMGKGWNIDEAILVPPLRKLKKGA